MDADVLAAVASEDDPGGDQLAPRAGLPVHPVHQRDIFDSDHGAFLSLSR